MRLSDLARSLDTILEPGRFQDYCPNGLQVEGRAEVRRIATGVTASAALIEAAIAEGADAILVHHGLFWKGDDPRLVGPKRVRIARLLAADVSLFGFHLPLDAHPTLGNNAELARRFGFTALGSTGEQDLVRFGTPAAPCTLGDLAASAARVLAREPLVIGDPAKRIERVAWCSGGAQDYFADAIGAGVDAYLTGEIAEQHYHMAVESGVGYIAAGHHATERFGIQALGEHLAREHGLAHRFIDVPNPV